VSYIVTARKWRPMVFEDVLGQQHIATTLSNAIRLDRLAHAYIFSGPRGVGKTTMARILARAVNCRSPRGANPCNECDMCQEITGGRSLDVIEIDGASNRGIDEIRNLRESARYAPVKGKRKIYIIDEVHMLTKEAFNALLKTLEEPPSQVLFIFATTEVHKVPSTILSRCQRFEFRRIPVEQIVERLRFISQNEAITIDEESLLRIAKKGEGSMRDSQSIFDQVASFCGETIRAEDTNRVLNVVDEAFFFRVTDLVKQRDTKEAVALAAEIVDRGYDIREFLNCTAEHLRNLLICAATGDASLLEVSPQVRVRYAEEAREFSEEDLLRLITFIVEAENAVRWAPQPRFRLEACFVQLAKFDRAVEIQPLIERIERLTGGSSGPEGGNTAPADRPESTGGALRSSGKPKDTPTRAAGEGIPSAAAIGETAHARREALSPAADPPKVPMVSGPPDPANAEAVLPQWNSLVDVVRKDKIHLGMILDEARIAGVVDGVLRVTVPDKLHLARLKKEKQWLTERLQTVAGTKLLLDFEYAERPVSPHGSSGTQAPPAGGSEGLHPIEQTIIREFGAEPLEG